MFLSIFTCRLCMRECWKNVFGVLETPGNFSEQKSGNPVSKMACNVSHGMLNPACLCAAMSCLRMMC